MWKDCQTFWSTDIFIVLKEAEMSIGDSAFQSETILLSIALELVAG